MQSRIKFHVDYEGQPTIELVSVNNQEDQRDILVNIMMNNIEYPNGYKKNVPFDIPKGLFAVEELMPNDTASGECGSEMKTIGKKYTLVPLSKLSPPYIFKNDDFNNYINKPKNIEEAIQGVIDFYQFIGFTESKHIKFLAEYLQELKYPAQKI